MELPVRLESLIDALIDKEFAARFRTVCEAAAAATDSLRDIDFVRYEEGPLQPGLDLSTWEQLAPAMASTLKAVNSLLSETEVYFESADDGTAQYRLVQKEVQDCTTVIRAEVAEFGHLIKTPAIVADGWKLIETLQVFRARFRDHIDNLVFESASKLEMVRRKEVAPGYEDQLRSALLVRSTTADLKREIRTRIDEVLETATDEVERLMNDLEQELHVFGRTPAWRSLRAQDKRCILEFRLKLQQLRDLNARPRNYVELAREFRAFVDGFEAINRRAILRENDNEVSKKCFHATAQIRPLIDVAPTQARQDFVSTVKMAQSLYGRSATLDGFLRRVRRTETEQLDVSALVPQFSMLLSELAV